MDNGLIFPYHYLLISRDGEGYTGQILVTGLNVRDEEKWRKHFELRREYEILRY